MKKAILIMSKRMGDVIFTTPTLEQLASHCPGLQIDVVTLSSVGNMLLENNPAIHRTFFPHEITATSLPNQYDVIIGMHGNSAIYDYLKPIKAQAIIAKKNPEIHIAEYLLQFVAKIFSFKPDMNHLHYRLYPEINHQLAVDDLLKPLSHTKKIVGLHLGSNAMSRHGRNWLRKIFRWKLMKVSRKCWPVNNFLQFIEKYQQQYPDTGFILTGTQNEAFMAKPFAKLPSVINLIGKTSPLALAALIQRLDLFISGDTGPLHVACAMDIPTIALFGKTDPSKYGPRPLDHLRKLVIANSLPEITTDQVLKIAKELETAVDKKMG